MLWDIAIVGGGPAGLSTALHLHACAPQLRVVVLERARYPRDKTCAGAIGGRALPLLARFGIRLPGTVPALPVSRFLVEIGGRRIDAHQPGGAVVIRRRELDHALARAAKERGIEVREGARATGIARSPAGVCVLLEDGTTVEARAIVGADGVTGIVRRAIGVPRAQLIAQAIEVDTPRVPGDPPTDTIRFVFDPSLRGYRWDFPTPIDGQPWMSRGVYLLRDQRAPGDDVRSALAEHLTSQGLRLADHQTRQLAEHGLDPGAPLSTPRVLLVGEAAGIDFPTGEGIAQALHYGAIAAPYLAEALARDRLGFLDWRATLLRTDEGRFMRHRFHLGRVLFGAQRPRIERALSRSPRVFQAALGRFAGRSISHAEAARALVQLGINAARR